MANGAPMLSVSLARILGLPVPKLVKALDRISEAGVSSREDETGALMNRRMVRDENMRHIRAEAGKLGGNPELVNREVKQKVKVEVNLGPEICLHGGVTPSSSSSPSTSKPKNKHGSFENVKLTDEEHEKLCAEFGIEGARDRIENLSIYIASKGKKYSSHYATILTWERKNSTNGNRPRPAITY